MTQEELLHKIEELVADAYYSGANCDEPGEVEEGGSQALKIFDIVNQYIEEDRKR